MEVDGPLARRLVPEPIVLVGRQREPRHSPDQSLQDQARIDCCYPTSTSEKHDIMPQLPVLVMMVQTVSVFTMLLTYRMCNSMHIE